MKAYLLSLSMLFTFTSQLPAAILIDSGGFEGFNTGQLVGQSGGGALAWSDLLPPEGSKYIVQSAMTNGGTRAVSVTSTSQIPSYVAPLINYTPAANELVVIEVDIARTTSSRPLLDPSSYSYAIEVYDQSVPDPTAAVRFGLRANLANDGIEAFVARQGAAFVGTEDLIPNVTVGQNQWVSFRAELNYATDRFSLFVNGNEVASNLGFITPTNTLSDVDLNHNTTVGSTDIGYFDNYRVSTITVPEPGSWGVGLVTLVGLINRRKRHLK